MTETMFQFGPFRLCPRQRLLLEGERAVQIGSRAMDILIALVERCGELVSKRELLARIWPNMVVVEGNLTVHITTLRRALRDGKAGNRYLINIPGQGYRFVAPVRVVEDASAVSREPDSSVRDVGVATHGTRPLLGASPSDTDRSLQVLTAVASALGLEVWSGSALAGLSDRQIRRLIANGGRIFTPATRFAEVTPPRAPSTRGGNAPAAVTATEADIRTPVRHLDPAAPLTG